MKTLLTWILIILTLLSFSCSPVPDSKKESEANNLKIESEPKTDVNENVQNKELSNYDTLVKGKGNRSFVLYMENGDAKFDLNVTGNIDDGTEQNFWVDVKNANKSFRESLTNALGNYEGSYLINLPKGDFYLIDVTAYGKWNVKINYKKNLSKTIQYHSNQIDTIYSGHGNKSFVLQLRKGNCFIDLSVTGNIDNGIEQNLMTDIRNSDKSFRESLSNGMGNCSTNMLLYIPTDGYYTLEINSYGKWLVKIH